MYEYAYRVLNKGTGACVTVEQFAVSHQQWYCKLLPSTPINGFSVTIFRANSNETQFQQSITLLSTTIA